MSDPLLRMTGVSKSFEGVQALKSLDLDLWPGEVHAVVGENGAGKSTMVKIVSGLVQPDQGDLLILGRQGTGLGPRDRLAAGLAVVYQDTAVFRDCTVMENVFMGFFPRRRWGRGLPWRQMERQIRGVFDELGIQLPLFDLAASLSAEGLCILGIVRALVHGPKALLMDEPTASLDRNEAERLFKVVQGLKGRGAGILYISHRLEEVFELSDRVTVLRDGERVSTRPRSECTPRLLVKEMVGREMLERPQRDRVDVGPEALALQNVATRTGLAGLSLSIRQGEVLGVAGLVGSGRTRLMRALFGLDPIESGQIHVRGQQVEIKSPQEAIHLGIALIPEDRTRQGLALPHSAQENMVSAILKKITRCGLVSRSRARALSKEMWDRLAVRGPSLDSEAKLFSGGNQQKIVLAKWLAGQPSLLLMDDPTKGVDVGAKEEIHAIMRELCRHGLAILFASSELPELLSVTDRIAVMREGRIVGLFESESTPAEAILASAFGAH